MGIQKRNFITALMLVIFFSCDQIGQNKNEIQAVRDENVKLIQSANEKQLLLDNWFGEFGEIQKQVFSINTDEILMVNLGLKEGSNIENTDLNRVKNKIERIKILIAKNEELAKTANINKTIISNLRDQLLKKEAIILNLTSENIALKNQYRELSLEADRKEELVKSLQKRIDELNLFLNKKYAFIFSSEPTVILDLTNNSQFSIPYRKGQIQILSDQPENSYSLERDGKNTNLFITNPRLFWTGSNQIIIKIRKFL